MLVINEIPKRYNEGLFWGNGVMGGLLYTEGSCLRIAVDHCLLWETRDTTDDTPAPGATFPEILKNPQKFISGECFSDSSQNKQKPKIWRTRLPGLSLNVDLGGTITAFHGDINIKNATSTITVTAGENTFSLNIYVDSCVNILKLSSDRTVDISVKGWDIERLREWGYLPYYPHIAHCISHALQPFSENGLAVISMKNDGSDAYITINVGTTENRDTLIAQNEQLLCSYAERETDYRAAHDKSWADFWSRFTVKIPNERLQSAFDIEMYKLYCNARKDSAPVALQGIWNNDGRMPAWCGDFHNDLNISACYWSAFKTNNAHLAEAYINHYVDSIPRLTERAYKMFGIEDAIHTPVMMGLNGWGTGAEWSFWNMLIGPELFNAADFCWFFEYTQDTDKLKTHIYPFIEKVLNLYIGVAYMGGDKYLHIPFTNSPEVFKDGKMLFKDDATIVISALHYLLGKMVQYGKIIGCDTEKWSKFDNDLVPVATTNHGYPLFPDEDLFESHRHFCQLFPLFPLGTDCHSPTANASLNRVIDMGLTEYASWSFPYLAILAARCGRGNMARTMLEIYCMAFRSKNTFTTNGDPNQNGLLRVSETNAGESSDTFTLEAGFIMAAAICEMFVHRSDSTIYVGYGLPDDWETARCENITIEGGHRVCVSVTNHSVSSLTIHPKCSEVLSVRIKGDSRSHEAVLAEGVPYCISV